MANDNNESKSLVTLVDEDPTIEFDMPRTVRPRNRKSAEIELDENTYGIDGDDAENVRASDTELGALVDEQARRIQDLDFENAHLRSQFRSLDEELKARVEIAEQYSRESNDLRKALARTEKQLDSRTNDFASMKSDLDAAHERISEYERAADAGSVVGEDQAKRIRSLTSKLRARDKSIADLRDELRISEQAADEARRGPAGDTSPEAGRQGEHAIRQRLADLQIYIEGRKDAWNRQNEEIERLGAKVLDAESACECLTAEVDDLKRQLKQSRDQYKKNSSSLTDERRKARELGREVKRLKNTVLREMEQQIVRHKQEISRQSGDLAAQRQEILRLRTDNSRFEKYADSLRQQLQDQIAIAGISVALRRKLESRLDSSAARIHELTEELNAARGQVEELTAAKSQMRKDFDQEVRQIRFELGAAQDTIADQETLNQQLAADLVEREDFRRVLENQLDSSQEESEQSFRRLNLQLKKHREAADEYERKMRIKDAAIADLMRELAAHSSNIELSGEHEAALTGIDGFKGDESNRSSKSRDKVARLLIGKSDGRDLRFPLFKDRLTIGRTSHNDIQLKMQFISRRHAVIAIDHGKTRVIDWGSKNGVYVNKTRVTEQVLESGDVVTIGMTEFRYEEKAKR